ncbi:MAG: hypothetical protein ACLU4N_22895 [Butyricimonas faecihominis]
MTGIVGYGTTKVKMLPGCISTWEKDIAMSRQSGAKHVAGRAPGVNVMIQSASPTSR